MTSDLIFMKKKIVDVQPERIRKAGAFTQPNDDRIFINMFSGVYREQNIEEQLNKAVFHELVHKHGNKAGRIRDEFEIEEATERVFRRKK